MMRKFVLLGGMVVGVAAVIGMLVWSILPSTAKPDKKRDVSRKSVSVKASSDRTLHKIGIGKRVRDVAPAKMQAGKVKDKPKLVLADEEETALDEEQRAVLAEIRQALDSDDLRTIRKALGRLKGKALAQARREGHSDWTRFVPRVLRAAVVESLGWFGADALPDLVEYVADADNDVMRSALDAFEQAMADTSFGDRDRAAVIRDLSSILTDEDAIDWMLMEINNMRHSVAIETLQHMIERGTSAVKSKVPETIEFYTGEEDLTTAAKLRTWLEKNPDDPDDEEFYGPWDS